MAEQSPSPEALADLESLKRDHGLDAELVNSLMTSKEEARAHIGFFKRMMFISNGGVMTLGLVLAGYGFQKLIRGFSILAFICLIAGVLLFVKFATVLASMTRAIKEAEAVATKHKLI